MAKTWLLLYISTFSIHFTSFQRSTFVSKMHRLVDYFKRFETAVMNYIPNLSSSNNNKTSEKSFYILPALIFAMASIICLLKLNNKFKAMDEVTDDDEFDSEFECEGPNPDKMECDVDYCINRMSLMEYDLEGFKTTQMELTKLLTSREYHEYRKKMKTG